MKFEFLETLEDKLRRKKKRGIIDSEHGPPERNFGDITEYPDDEPLDP